MEKLISFDLKADFGLLKKPDTNEPIYITFNMLHKPALLGILGAILGLAGFKEKGKMPEYYEKLKDLKVGIQPLAPNNSKNFDGTFKKTIIRYNNGTGFASEETGGNLIINEQTLIKPAFRCYLLLDLQNTLYNKLYEYLQRGWAEYLPYLGKNDFSTWWEDFKEYDYEDHTYTKIEEPIKILSLFIKETSIKDKVHRRVYYNPVTRQTGSQNKFMYFENLPVRYNIQNTKMIQYEYSDFAFSNWEFKQIFETDKHTEFQLLKIHTEIENEYIQIF